MHQTDHVRVLLFLAFVKPQALFPEIFFFFNTYHLPSRARSPTVYIVEEDASSFLFFLAANRSEWISHCGSEVKPTPPRARHQTQ